MKRVTRVAVAATVAGLLVPGVVAAGDDTVGTASFEELTVTAGAGTIEVSGVATFNGEELLVGEDAGGDGAVPGSGTDITALRISQDPASGMLSIFMDTDLAAGVTAPELAWSFPIAGSQLEAAQLLAFSTDETGVPGSFQFGVGTGGGVNENFSITSVSGRVEGSTLIWEVTPAQIGVDPGASISIGDPAFSTNGGRNAAVIFVGGTPIDEALVQQKFGVGGGATVKVLDAAGEVVDEGRARVRRGSFSVSFSDLAPGAYTVEVTSVYADGKAVETLEVTVA